MTNDECGCINCECEDCGSQNPKRLVGKAAESAGVTDIRDEWFCDESCSCCDK